MEQSKDDILDLLVKQWKNERPDLDASPMLIVGRILKLGKLLEKRANAAIQDKSIVYTDLDVLATLRRSGKPYELTPKQLIESVLITSGAMTALLKRLEKLNLIYRAPSQKDGRVIKVGLTKKGFEVIDAAIEIRFEEARKTVTSLNRDERKHLAVLLKKMLQTTTFNYTPTSTETRPELSE
ncbi:MarR family winged helix-turn-helix transcriptional regulator [Flagellimonas meridianipacifica]|uniref:DNA-binding MarR family transcriptional regulator n=1 Tax=Flagellimonas meridianipacifica TaxID=1080225 RepID=A0A2T0MBT9_9FLAO|nr:MarR family transcriptional regulator [Allomuricauda pacifica]PRX54945.1 DNA-binding MarR family transcriptional regulator [Allomuricauda pacifica]